MSLSFLLFVVVMASIGSQEIRRAVAEQYMYSAFYTARTARTYLNHDHISDYFSPDGGEHPEECRYIHDEWQQRLANHDTQNISMIYLIQTEGEDYGRIKFGITAVHPLLLENHPDFKLHPIGAVAKSAERQRKAYAEIYNGAERAVVIQPWDWNEDHLTVFVPVKTDDNKVVGIICVQRNMNVLRAIIAKHARKVLFSAAVLLAIILPLFAWGLRKWLLNPLKTITRETLRFAEKNTMPESKLSASIQMSNEIGRLARSIDIMEEQNVRYVENLTQAARKEEQIQAELNVARDIQLSMLSTDFNISGVDLYASMEAAKEVGGDFYNFYVLDEDRLVITIADVSGKGIPASLFMLVSMGLLWSFVPDSPGAFARALDAANLWLCSHNDGMMFVTVFTGILNRRTGKFTYVNAGHNSPLISRREQSNKFEYLPMAQNGFIGINDKAEFREETITLNHGDWLFLYTDGLTEAENGEHDFFGDDRLLDTLNEFNNSSAKELISYVHKRVKDFVGIAPQSDDLTMLCVRYM